MGPMQCGPGLEERHVDGGLLRLLLGIAGRIVHHGDDLARLIFGRKIHLDVLADGIFVRPEAARHGFVDDHDPRRIGGIAHGKIAPAQHGNLHGLEEIWSHRIVERARRVRACVGRPSISKGVSGAKVMGARYRRGRRLHTRHALHALENALRG